MDDPIFLGPPVDCRSKESPTLRHHPYLERASLSSAGLDEHLIWGYLRPRSVVEDDWGWLLRIIWLTRAHWRDVRRWADRSSGFASGQVDRAKDIPSGCGNRSMNKWVYNMMTLRYRSDRTWEMVAAWNIQHHSTSFNIIQPLFHGWA